VAGGERLELSNEKVKRVVFVKVGAVCDAQPALRMHRATDGFVGQAGGLVDDGRYRAAEATRRGSKLGPVEGQFSLSSSPQFYHRYR